MSGAAHLFTHRMPLEADATPQPQALPRTGGVYLLADAQQRPILLASCEDLRRVVSARLCASDTERRTRRADLAAVARWVFWTPSFSRFETAYRYHAAAARLYPGRHRKLLGFGRAWFLRLDVCEPAPRITPVSDVDDGAEFVGPMPARRDAESTIAVLEDLFDLCRRYDILRQAPHGRACEYLDMGRCPAPCDGRFSMEAYRDMLRSAMAFAGGTRNGGRVTELAGRMRSAAAALEFERAATIRSTIERAAAWFDRPELRYMAPLAQFRWLVLQRGGPRTRSTRRLTVRTFFAGPDGLVEGPVVPWPELAGWLDDLRRVGPTEPPAHNLLPRPALPTTRNGTGSGGAGEAASPGERSERLWLVCHYLLRAESTAGQFYRLAALPEGSRIADEVRQRLLGSEPEAPPDPAGVPGDPACDPPADGDARDRPA